MPAYCLPLTMKSSACFQDLERLLDSLGCRPIAGLYGGLAAVLMPPVADHSDVGSQYLV